MLSVESRPGPRVHVYKLKRATGDRIRVVYGFINVHNLQNRRPIRRAGHALTAGTITAGASGVRHRDSAIGGLGATDSI